MLMYINELKQGASISIVTSNNYWHMRERLTRGESVGEGYEEDVQKGDGE